MEYIDGQNIGEFIQNYFPPLEEIALDDIFLQLIDAFCYIEEHGIIHRDIREGNILISKDGTVKIIDFGIGKIIPPNESGNTDSLVADINRAASDTLPQEYYDGVYTSRTDMFYLAELFSRLINNAEYCDRSFFSYNEILDKMMEKQPENRFESFSAVREAIGKHDFVNLEISNEDKRIYQDFTNLVYESLSFYTTEPRFNTDCAIFISRLENALTTNLFETIIQKNVDVINSVVECDYRYNSRVKIPNDIVRKFLDWFRASTPQSQALVLNNFISKISDIQVEEPEPEVPF